MLTLSVCGRAVAGCDFQMSAGTYRVGQTDTRDTLIIASEPLTFEVDDWTLVPANHLIVAMPGASDTDDSGTRCCPKRLLIAVCCSFVVFPVLC